MAHTPRSKLREKRAGNANPRRKASFAAGVSLRHVGLCVAALLAIGGALAGWTMGAQEARTAALTATRLAETGEIGPAPKAAAGRDSRDGARSDSARRAARDRAFTPLRYRAALALGLTSLLSAAVCLFLFRRLVVARVERVVAHIRRAAHSPESVGRLGRLVPGPFDTSEIVALLASVNDGLAELELRNRTRTLVKDTAERLRRVEEAEFLGRACEGLVALGEASQARAWIVRAREDDGGFLIERNSDSRASEAEGHSNSTGGTGAGGAIGKAAGSRSGTYGGSQARVRGERAPASKGTAIDDLLTRGNMAEYQGEAALQFLRGGLALDRVSSTLYLRTDLTQGGEMLLVTAVTPEPGPEGRPAPTALQFEHICSLWASEVARAWHQTRFQDIVSNLEFSRQLRRTWVQGDDGNPAAREGFAWANVPSRFVNGDFLCVFRLAARDSSLVVLGDVTGHELGAGLAATGCVAAVSDRFEALKEAPPHKLLEGLVESLNRYVWMSHRGALGLRALVFHVSHATGQGTLCCFGAPFPYVLGALERKPMVVVPAFNPGMMGFAPSIDATPTGFTLLPGQVLFASTEGVLATRDGQGKRFEKLVQRGVLSEAMGFDARAPAAALLDRFLDAARTHAGNTLIREDLTAVVVRGPERG